MQNFPNNIVLTSLCYCNTILCAAACQRPSGSLPLMGQRADTTTYLIPVTTALSVRSSHSHFYSFLCRYTISTSCTPHS